MKFFQIFVAATAIFTAALEIETFSNVSTDRRRLIRRINLPVLQENNLLDDGIARLINLIQQRAAHACNLISTINLLKHHTVDRDDNSNFNVNSFLLAIQHKTISIFGDTVGLQLFHALEIELQTFETIAHNGNGTHTSYLYHCNKRLNSCGYVEPEKNRHFAAIRFYGKYNASLVFCSDPLMTSITEGSGKEFDFCGKRAMKSDFIIIANSAWYRPAGTDLDTYYRSLFRRERKLAVDYYKIRKKLMQINPQATVIWRTMPHVGPIDQYTARGFNNPAVCCPDKLLPDCCFPHRSGQIWSNISMTAEWVLRYNEIIYSLRQNFNDEIIDWYKLSIKYISYFNERQISSHSDSMHWCDGGLPRAANLLLQQCIFRARQRQVHNSRDRIIVTDREEQGHSFEESVTFAMLPIVQPQRSTGLYAIKRGLWPQWATESYLASTIFNRSAYNCYESTFRFLLRHHLERLPPKVVSPSIPVPHPARASVGFDAEFFLNMIRGKTFAILGDSLGRQIFHALDHDLMHFESEAINGNGTQTTITYVCKKKLNWCGFVEPLRNRYYAAIRHYKEFNATVFFCNDPFLQSPRFQRGGNHEFCGRRAIASDFILLATGPWYKPRGEV